MYSLFKGPKSKQKLSKDFDQFDRDHSPLYERDRYARDYHVARAEVDKALANVGPLDGPLWDADQSELLQELERRKKMITEGDRLKKDVNLVLDKMEEYSTKVDEESTRLRTEIKDHVLSILPQTKERFDKIEAVIQSELNRLTSANTQLTIDNTMLKTQAGTSKVTGELENLVQRVNKRDEQDAQELAKLRKVPGQFELAKQAWNHEKGTFEQNERKLQGELESMQRQRDDWKAHSEGQDKEVETANRSKEDAEANVASVLQQREEVDGQLKHAKANAEGEKRRADALQGELEAARKESEEARSELEELQRQIATPRSLDAAGRDNHELFVLRQEAKKWETWRNNRVAEVEKLKKEKEELKQEKETLATRVEELEREAPFSEEMERQMTSQLSNLDSDKEELENQVSRLKISTALKGNEIAKLRRKYQMMDDNFEWVKGRMLEYYGLHQTSMRDNQQLRESNKQMCEALQGVSAERDLLKAEKASLAVTESETDELITQMMESAKALEALRSSRRSSSRMEIDMDPSTSSGTLQTPTPAAQPLGTFRRPETPSGLNRSSPQRMRFGSSRRNRQATPPPPEPLGRRRSSVTSAMSLESSMSDTGIKTTAPRAEGLSDAFQMPAVPSRRDSVDPVTSREEFELTTPPRHEESMTFVGIGANNMRRRLSVASSASSEYVSPYGRGTSSSPDPFGPRPQEVNQNRPSPSATTSVGGNPQQAALVQSSRILQLSLNPGTFSSLPLQQTMGGPLLTMQPPPIPGTFGPQSPQQLASVSSALTMQPPPTAGTLGPAPNPQQPTQNFSFLVSGSLATGQRTLNVRPSVFQMMVDQATKWDRRMDRYHWTTKTSVSHQRCVDTRIVCHFSHARNPPASANPNAACASCVNKGILCVLIGDNGPVVVPLPLSDRSLGATPIFGDYFVKTRQRAPVVLPQLPPP